MVKPNIVISKCLEFEACRYDGGVITNDFVRELEPFVNFVQVCPEVEIGLSVPRSPIRLVSGDDKNFLLDTNTGNDLTDKMQDFSEEFLGSLPEVDGFILKGKSPSCGVSDAKIYSGISKSDHVKEKGDGIFSLTVQTSFEKVPIETEGRLLNFTIRDRFLTAIYAFARFRQITSMKELVGFHSNNKFLFMAYNQNKLRVLGQIAANHDKKPLEVVLKNYKENLKNIFEEVSSMGNQINALEHELGFISDKLSKPEREHFLSILEKYRKGRIPLSVCSNILKALVIRFQEDYLMSQTFFEPYPDELLLITDSGKGRDL